MAPASCSARPAAMTPLPVRALTRRSSCVCFCAGQDPAPGEPAETIHPRRHGHSAGHRARPPKNSYSFPTGIITRLTHWHRRALRNTTRGVGRTQREQDHRKQMEYVADGNKDPQAVPWSPLRRAYSVSEKGGDRGREQERDSHVGFLLFHPQRPEEEMEHPQTAKNALF